FTKCDDLMRELLLVTICRCLERSSLRIVIGLQSEFLDLFWDSVSAVPGHAHVFVDMSDRVVRLRPFSREQAKEVLSELLAPTTASADQHWKDTVSDFCDTLVSQLVRTDGLGRLQTAVEVVVPAELQLIGWTLEQRTGTLRAYTRERLGVLGGRSGLYRLFLDDLFEGAGALTLGVVTEQGFWRFLALFADKRMGESSITVADGARAMHVRESLALSVMEFLRESRVLRARGPDKPSADTVYELQHPLLRDVIEEAGHPKWRIIRQRQKRLEFYASEWRRRTQGAPLRRGRRVLVAIGRPPVGFVELVALRTTPMSREVRSMMRFAALSHAVRAGAVVLCLFGYYWALGLWPLSVHWYRSPFLSREQICDPAKAEGTYCLLRAAAAGDLGAVRYIAERGADIEAVDANGETPLYIACTQYGGNIECAEYLLLRGANPNAPNKFGYTPIHGAAYLGNQRLFDLLVNNGADPRHADIEGMTPLHKAVRSKNEQGSALIIQALCTTLAANPDRGVNINAADIAGNTPLHAAVMLANAAKVRQLVQLGAAPQAKNAVQWTCRELARQLHDRAPSPSRREILDILSD
ncbi:MAG: ankyrin repeat domain-containing protein, partial [Phycisphaerales bacterium]